MTLEQQRTYLISHIVEKCVEYLIADRDISVGDAMRVVYNSEVYDVLLNPNSGLTSQSPAYIYQFIC